MKNTKQYKILLIGQGSIGKRHLNNLFSIGQNDITVFDVNKTSLDEAIKKFPNIKISSGLESSLAEAPDIVFICSPTSFHAEHITLAAKAGAHIFIEKPLCSSVKKKDIDEIESLIKSSGKKFYIGFNNRFEPGIRKLKELIDKKTIGDIYFFKAEVGFFLGYWRKGTDYTKSYSSSKNKGGGAIFDWSHELDYLSWIFGKPEQVSCLSKNAGTKLVADIDDFTSVMMDYKNNVAGVLTLDCLQKTYSRTCKVVGENGSILFDFKKKKIDWIIVKDEKETTNTFEYRDFDYNETYISEIKEFIDSISENRDIGPNLDVALSVQRVIKSCLDSSKNRKFENIGSPQ